MSRTKSKNKTNQAQIATDFDRLIVDIAACDDWDMIDYYCDMLQYIAGLANYRKATIETAGFGAFLSDNFKRRFDTKDEAHKYIVTKIVAIHDCDEEEIKWEDYDDVGYCRAYWVGEKSYFSIRDKIATIQSVDDDDAMIHIFRIHDTPPDYGNDLDYQSPDETTRKLSPLVKENLLLKSRLHSLFQKCHSAWDEVHIAKSYAKGDAHKRLEEWLKANTDLLQNEE